MRTERPFASLPARILGMAVASVLLSTITPADAKPCISRDAWTGQDKTKHFVSGAVLAAGVTLITEDAALGFWTASTVALVKEIKDRRDPAHQCSLQDMLATVAGAGAGASGARLLIAPQRGGVQVFYRKEI